MQSSGVVNVRKTGIGEVFGSGGDESLIPQRPEIGGLSPGYAPFRSRLTKAPRADEKGGFPIFHLSVRPRESDQGTVAVLEFSA